MDRAILENLLSKFHGCTFATLDATTFPKKNIRSIAKIETGKRVLLCKRPHYGDMVKRRLEEAGKNPDNFVLGDLAWGSRVPNSPLIEYDGKTYLQVIELAKGKVRYTLFGDGDYDPRDLGLRIACPPNQGLPEGSEVIVRSYELPSIDRIVLMGETLTAEKRSILKLKI